MATVTGAYVSVVHAAQMLGVHPNTVRAWLQDGVLSGRRLRRNYEVSVDDIETMIATSTFSARRP